MIESITKIQYQRYITQPISAFLHRYTNISAINVTATACILGILAALLLIYQYNLFACCTLILSGFLDSLDGALARESNTTSEQGAVFDIVSDRIIEFMMMFALYTINPTLRALPVLWMLGSTLICVTSFLVVGIFSENNSKKGFYYSVGIMERFEAFVFFILMILLPSLFSVLAWSYTILVLLTASIRIYQFTTKVI